MSSELRFDIQRAWRPSFSQALQLVRCFDSEPGSPRGAALLSMLFQQLHIQSSLKTLHSWLYEYVSVFATDTPRDQTDLIEKTLAIAVYLRTSEQNSFNIALPEGSLIDYIEYASRQSWLGDPFLAFYCSSIETVHVCRNAEAYFEANFERFLAKRHIPGICQALLVLDGRLSKLDRERAYETVCSIVLNQDAPLAHASWGLMALHRSVSIDTCQSVSRYLTERLDAKLTELMSAVVKESQLFGLLALIWSGADQTNIVHHLRDSATDDHDRLVHVDLDSPGTIRLAFNVTAANGDSLASVADRPPLTDISLALIAMHTAGRHRLIGVPESEEERLISALQRAQQLEKESSVIISRPESIVGSILGITMTVVVGLGVILYFSGSRVRFSLDLSQVSWRDIDVFLWLIVWVDYVLSQIQAFRSGKSAIAGMLEIPIVRHLTRFARSHGSRLRREVD